MLLDVRPLNDFQNVNSYRISDALEIYSGDQQNLYFQIVDRSLDRSFEGFNPPGRRYCPPATSVLTATLNNIDGSQIVVRICSQPTSQDPSIFLLPILSSDPISGTVAFNLVLNEPSRTLNATFAPGIMVRVH